MSTTYWLGQHLPQVSAESILKYKHFWMVLLGKLSVAQPANRFHTLVEHGGSLRYETRPYSV